MLSPLGLLHRYRLVNFRSTYLKHRLPLLLLGEVKCIVGHLTVARPHIECVPVGGIGTVLEPRLMTLSSAREHELAY